MAYHIEIRQYETNQPQRVTKMDASQYQVGVKFVVEGEEWTITDVKIVTSRKGNKVRLFTLSSESGNTLKMKSRGMTLWINGGSRTESAQKEEAPAPVADSATAAAIAAAVTPSVDHNVDHKMGVFVPEVNDTYYITPDIVSLFDRVHQLSLKKTQKILLRGPHGAGKTEMAMQFAARHNKPMLIMDCANLKEPRDWFGYKTIVGGEVVWHESQFDKVLSAGGHVILLDEVNRVHPSVMNTLLPILDGRGFTYLEEKGGCITVGPNTVFFSTMNEGASYTGTSACDIALRDRLGQRIVEVTYLPKDREVKVLVERTGIDARKAASLVDIANQIRVKSSGLGSSFSDGFSTRQLIAAAEDFVVGGVQSLTFTMSNLFSAEGGTNSERATVLQLIQGKFGTT